MIDNKDMPAFPTITWEQLPNGQFVQVTEYSGLTKREKIAAMAMQGIVASRTIDRVGKGRLEIIAADAVKIADALLTELSKPQP